MNADLYYDQSWETARNVAKECLSPPSALSRLIRNSWNGSMTAKGIVEILVGIPLPPTPFIRAAQLFDPAAADLESSIGALGFRGAASVAAVYFSCAALTSLGDSERARAATLQSVADSIEIGYHFGLSASPIGPDVGILIGFAQSIGPALLSLRHRLSAEEARNVMRGAIPSTQLLAQFECEPYQVSALALQRLGFGVDFASAATMALGNPNMELISNNADANAWSAASEWISALILGRAKPRRHCAAAYFPDLSAAESEGTELPLHLQMLNSCVDAVRDGHSAWTWHKEV